MEKEKFYAIGEIGIDLYWDNTYFNEQVFCFRKQLDFAVNNNMPVSIHVRNSMKEVFSVLEDYRNVNLKGVFHCFSGTQKSL